VITVTHRRTSCRRQRSWMQEPLWIRKEARAKAGCCDQHANPRVP